VHRDREKARTYQRKYRAAHPEKVKLWARAHHLSHKEEENTKSRIYYHAHKHIKRKQTIHTKQNRQKYNREAKLTFLDMYGHQCACCNEKHEEFLTLEHIGGMKGEKREGSATQAYRKAVIKYRPDLYKVLCMNCNFAIGRHGQCPHNKLTPPEVV